MDWDITEVRVIREHVLHVRFKDGIEGEVTFKPTFFQGVFEPLRDPALFRKVQATDGFVSWPSSNLDLAPDAMHTEIKCRQNMVLD